MTDFQNAYGPDQRCQRTTCITDGPADHLGRAHLDPHDRERFDGNGTSLQAATYKVRSELVALDRVKDAHPDLAEVIDVAIHVSLKEIYFLNSQLAHVRVDADHRVLDASRRALDCEHHGQTIQGLEEQLPFAEQRAERCEKARLALLSGITAFDQFIEGVDNGTRMGQPLPDTATVVESIRGVLRKVHAAHTRAWSTPRKKR